MLTNDASLQGIKVRVYLVWRCNARIEHSNHLSETSSAKGRVERAHLTIQNRLVKELRLSSISSVEAANAFYEEFMNDYNRRFSMAPKHEFDVHRTLAIEDSELSRRAIGKFWHYPEGHKELRLNWCSLNGIITGHRPCLLETGLRAGVKSLQRSNPSVPWIRRRCLTT